MVSSDKTKKLVIYEEAGKVEQAWAIIEEITNSYITFKTESNRITIPLSRLIKIKEAI